MCVRTAKAEKRMKERLSQEVKYLQVNFFILFINY